VTAAHRRTDRSRGGRDIMCRAVAPTLDLIQAGRFFARELREKTRIKESKKKRTTPSAKRVHPSFVRRGVFSWALRPRSEERGNLKDGAI
jgi:hypothetical protein